MRSSKLVSVGNICRSRELYISRKVSINLSFFSPYHLSLSFSIPYAISCKIKTIWVITTKKCSKKVSNKTNEVANATEASGANTIRFPGAQTSIFGKNVHVLYGVALCLLYYSLIQVQ